jgi:LPXTG-motif cell wall-anchored protein
MAFFKVLGCLMLLAIACDAFLVATVGEQSRNLAEALGQTLTIFLIGALGAGLAALLTRRRKRRAYPGLLTGASLALVATLLSWLTITLGHS